MNDRNYIRAKDVTLIITVLTLLGTIWKLSGLDQLKTDVQNHTTQIAVIVSSLQDIKQDLKEIKHNTR